MKKDDIKKILKFEGADKDIEVAVNRVLDTLKAMPADADLGAMTSVEKFHENGFGDFQHPDTLLNIEREKEKTRILSNLESILLEVTTWIKDHPLQVKFNIISANQKKNSARRKWLIAVLVIIAAVAIALTIIQNVTSVFGTEVDIGEIVGLVDLVIGIGGFIYELADDNKKEAVCNAVQEISESKNNKELTDKAETLAFLCKRAKRVLNFKTGSAYATNGSIADTSFFHNGDNVASYTEPQYVECPRCGTKLTKCPRCGLDLSERS